MDDFRSNRLEIESVKIEDKSGHIYESTDVVSSRVSVKGMLGTRDISGTYQFTDTWVKVKGRWLAVASQQTQVRAS